MIGTTKVKFSVGQSPQVSSKMAKELSVWIKIWTMTIHEDGKPLKNTIVPHVLHLKYS